MLLRVEYCLSINAVYWILRLQESGSRDHELVPYSETRDLVSAECKPSCQGIELRNDSFIPWQSGSGDR